MILTSQAYVDLNLNTLISHIGFNFINLESAKLKIKLWKHSLELCNYVNRKMKKLREKNVRQQIPREIIIIEYE